MMAYIKKPLILLVVLSLKLSALAQISFIFTTNNGAITITSYIYSGGIPNLVIPTATNGYPVTAIKAQAFGRSLFTNVIIPASVTSIGDSAFSSSASLLNVTISNTVNSSITLGPNAFSECTSLKSVYFTGNAPLTNDTSIFTDDNNAKVYYLAGGLRWGWANTFGGLPTASFGALPPPDLGVVMYSNQPTIFFSPYGANYTLQMSTNLTSTNWVTVSNAIPVAGYIISNSYPAAFFRLH